MSQLGADERRRFWEAMDAIDPDEYEAQERAWQEASMTTDDHATHGLSTRIRALFGTRPSKGLLGALAAEVDALQRRLEVAEARIARMLEDDGTEAEAPAEVHAPVPPSIPGDGAVYTHG